MADLMWGAPRYFTLRAKLGVYKIEVAMKIELKRCRTCGALGVGPNAVKLFPLDDLLYCRPHYGKSLDWTANREAVVQGIESMTKITPQELQRVIKNLGNHISGGTKNWAAFISENAGMAAEALVMGDRRTFVYYFSRALWAWELSKL